jgi:hypothetical protein
MAISNGFWLLNLSVESLILREIVPTDNKKQNPEPGGRGNGNGGICWVTADQTVCKMWTSADS